MNVLLMGICFDFYYDLNDDTVMLDIMSGAYSGTPDGHNMQTLYPLGTLIALCYRLCDKVPWYGLFLLVCQFGCMYLVGVRLCVLTENLRPPAGKIDEKQRRVQGILRKAFLLFGLSFFIWGICLSHLIHIQYTVTSAILSAAALFLFLTTPDCFGKSPGQFVVRNLPAVLLAILSYQIRSEMLLLTLPFIGLAGLYRLAGEKKIFVKENLMKYGGVLGILFSGMLLSYGADHAAYGSAGWKDFVAFFEARTTVYDFYPELIREDAYQEALTRLGVTPVQQALLRNYNYGLDDEIDTKLLIAAADYATDVLRGEKDWGRIARKQLYRYFHRLFRGGDAPYSTLLIWLYIMGVVAGVYNCVHKQMKRSGRQEEAALHCMDPIGQIMLLAVVRSAVWMFILLRERDPERITHSLYLVEFSLLAAMMIRMSSFKSGVDQGIEEAYKAAPGRDVRHSAIMAVAAGFLFLILVGGLGSGVSILQADQEQRASVNENWRAIDAYCKARQENFYFEDVYSTVAFSRKIFDDIDCGYANYDILGGWICNSPLYREKIGKYGIESVTRALLERDDVYLIVSDLEAETQGWEWIEDFYEAKGVKAVMEKVDSVGEGYGVYRVAK